MRQTATKTSIEDAFVQLLSKKTLEKITIKDITDFADINRATFYAHYDDKYQLFDEILHNRSIELIATHTVHIVEHEHILVEPLLDAIFEYLLPVKEHCPYTYQSLLPKLREKMIAALIDYFKDSCPLSFGNEKIYFKIMLFARTIYDAAELKVVNKTTLSKKKIIEQLESMFHLKNE
ncbi:TetR family transcriptional regulator [uncultured Clostridium sp.]|uniref:TetR/AcrR family transcriptional regulator n=1 Tax=uncultured Clostridium sp. TaxID=59620 RepID=UPI0028F155FD|nr:TetR family transcriptional regulator [uncultured Clostridium sp.]